MGVKSERVYYEPLGAWALKDPDCFTFGVDKGLRKGRIDVLGFRRPALGSDWSGGN